jgi:hypothetical protein
MSASTVLTEGPIGVGTRFEATVLSRPGSTASPNWNLDNRPAVGGSGHHRSPP